MKAQFTNLYIKNLDPEMRQEEFEELFQQFGNVTSALIQIDEEGNSKGFGFVMNSNCKSRCSCNLAAVCAEGRRNCIHPRGEWT